MSQVEKVEKGVDKAQSPATHPIVEEQNPNPRNGKWDPM
jgi:hypothetical protein